MPAIKNVAIAGASGALGSVVFKKFVESGKFNIRVLKRAGSKSEFPANTEVVDVDYDSFDSLKAALEGQDAIISTVTTLAVESQIKLVDAAIAAGVSRFVPSEFGSNLDNASVRALPVFTKKVQIQDYLIEKSKSTPITYTFVYNSAFLDWGISHGFLLNVSSPNPQIVDGGVAEFSTTTLASVADALVGLVSHPEETKNRAVYIHDTITTQKKLLELAQKAAPERKWEPVDVKLSDLVAKANERLAKGLYDMETFAPYLFQAILGPKSEAKFEKTDNELLGVKGVTDEDIVELFRAHLN